MAGTRMGHPKNGRNPREQEKSVIHRAQRHTRNGEKGEIP